MYICRCPNQRCVWIEKLQRGERKKRKGEKKTLEKRGKNQGRLPYFRNNFYRRQESQEKHLHDLSHTCREVSILSGCVSISSAEPAATEVTEGCVPQFGLAPSTTFEMCTAVLTGGGGGGTRNNSYAFSFVMKNLQVQNLRRLTVTNLPHGKHTLRGENDASPAVSLPPCPFARRLGPSWNQVSGWRLGGELNIKLPRAFQITSRSPAQYFCLQAAGGRLTSAQAERLERRLKKTKRRTDTDPMRQTDSESKEEEEGGGGTL